MHNGLNERDGMELHYRVASHLIAQARDGSTAFILRPFPGHLTRFPFQAFAETPLDRYLADGSQLFRQFIRYMVETQWFLSALARRSSYRCASGANLLAESDDPATSRLSDGVLAAAISEAWQRLHDASIRTREQQSIAVDAPPVGRQITEQSIRAAVTALRRTLRLDQMPALDGEPADVQEPEVHVIGYSLGASTAESVFMTWPFLISSCATSHGGGALRELAPTGFAHPEEWQTVLRSLRYELDDRLAHGALVDRRKRIAGLEQDLFAHFKRTFYEVFQQDYRGGFQTRVSAFRKRMLFIVGGNDAIFAPSRILEAAPPGGINMLEPRRSRSLPVKHNQGRGRAPATRVLDTRDVGAHRPVRGRGGPPAYPGAQGVLV